MRRCWLYGGMISVVAALPAASYAEGFEGGRDQDMAFHAVKSPRSAVNFESKMPKETIKGVAKQFTGEITINPAKLDKLSGKFTVPFENLDLTKDGRPAKTMKDHMLGSEWIEADKFPDAVLTINSIDGVEAKKKVRAVKLTGTMAIHGVEKEVSIPASLTYVAGKEADGSKDTLAIQSKFEIKLADYEIKGRPGSLGKGVAETLKMSVSVMMKPPKSSDAPHTKEAAKPTIGRVRANRG